MGECANQILLDHFRKNSSVIYTETDDVGNITFCNNYLCNLTGKELAGENFSKLLVDFEQQFSFEYLKTFNNESLLLNIETKTGIPATYKFNFYKSELGYVIIGESNSQDTELLRKNLLDINSDLNNLSRELQKKNLELKKLNEEKSNFIGIVAHDLRNPISVIIGYSDFLIYLLSKSLSAEQIQMLEIVKETSENMIVLLEDLLDLKSLESGKLNLNKTSTNLCEMVEKNVQLNNTLAGKKDIKINFNCSNIIPDIEIDKLKIAQVLNNLISNAIKFSQPGTLVNVKICSQEGNTIISVADAGPGISKEEQKLLFQAFSKISVKTTAGEKSTGLGLSIVKNIVLGHGGKIWVESEPGKGSTFYFSIPFN